MSPFRRAVLVTGASSGIGRAIAVMLRDAGWRVFAGMRSERAVADMCALSEHMVPIRMDVTDVTQIEEARRAIADIVGGKGLQGLVNNAGIGVAGPLEYLPVDDFRRVMDTNVVGQVAVTQAFLPMIRVGHGRIVNIGSGQGFVALPFFSAYAASKFAMEAVTDSLRRELSSWNIPVSIVEPGTTRTPILAKGFDESAKRFAAFPPEGQTKYREMYEIVTLLAERALKKGTAPEVIAGAVRHALESPRPRLRYTVDPEARMARFLRLLPGWLEDVLVRAGMKRLSGRGRGR